MSTPEKTRLRASVKALEHRAGRRPTKDTARREFCAGIDVEPTREEYDDYVLCYVKQYDDSFWIPRSYL